MNFDEQLGWTIAQAREFWGMSLNELARAADISPSYLSEVERGKKSIAFRRLVPIAKELGLSLDVMIDRKLTR